MSESNGGEGLRWTEMGGHATGTARKEAGRAGGADNGGQRRCGQLRGSGGAAGATVTCTLEMRSALTKSSFHTGSSKESFAAITKAASKHGCQLVIERWKRVPLTARCT